MNKRIAIFGWYGSETLGDKAILGGIIESLLTKGHDVNDITLLSFNVNYSVLTMLDLGYSSIPVLDLYQVKNNKEMLAVYDIYIMGGGPLCDIEEMIYILEIFDFAKKQGKETIVFSCGVGPLNLEKYQYVFTEILSLSNKILFRDSYTPNKYKKLIGNHKYEVAIDPAFNYIFSQKSEIESPIIPTPYVMFCLRKWPKLYSHGLTEEDYQKIVEGFEKSIIKAINDYFSNNIRIVLFPMHNYYFGDDDREYFLELCDKYDLWDKVEIIGHEYTVKDSLNYFNYATKVFAMRFHSVVFSIALNTDFIALEYQIDDGKITGVLDLVGLSDKSVKMSSFRETNSLSHLIKEIDKVQVDWNQVNLKLNKQLTKFI